MISRDKYLKQLIDSKDNGFPKVITGIRRCGKSFLLKDIYREYLISEGIEENSILILELDDDRNIAYRDPIELGRFVRKFCEGKSRRPVKESRDENGFTIIGITDFLLRFI